MGYIVGHVLGDFFCHPVAVHAFGCDDQGEVDEAIQIELADVVEQHLRFSCSHLHEEAELGSLPCRSECVPLVLERF
jgi:hypothetical protein